MFFRQIKGRQRNSTAKCQIRKNYLMTHLSHHLLPCIYLLDILSYDEGFYFEVYSFLLEENDFYKN
jgi:hypothetical protein